MRGAPWIAVHDEHQVEKPFCLQSATHTVQHSLADSAFAVQRSSCGRDAPPAADARTSVLVAIGILHFQNTEARTVNSVLGVEL